MARWPDASLTQSRSDGPFRGRADHGDVFGVDARLVAGLGGLPGGQAPLEDIRGDVEIDPALLDVEDDGVAFLDGQTGQWR